jgi:hypothetical protein
MPAIEGSIDIAKNGRSMEALTTLAKNLRPKASTIPSSLEYA